MRKRGSIPHGEEDDQECGVKCWTLLHKITELQHGEEEHRS